MTADCELVGRSLSLYERIDLFRAHPEAFAEPGPRASELLAKWQRLFETDDDPGAFDRRLAFDGLDRATVLRVLGPLTLPGSTPAPTWLAVITEVLAEMARGLGPALAGADEMAFGDYWSPWIRVALRRVPAWSSFPDAVRETLAHHLLQDLARSGTQCLVHDFELYRATQRSSNELFLERVATAPSTELYRAFIDALHGEGARSFLELYPGLARLCATRVEQWSRNITELASRLDRDLLALETCFGSKLGTLSALEVGLSDSHNGGRSVAIVQFSSGTRVLYKPKDLGTERAFQSLVRRANELGLSPPLRTLAVVEGDHYGWVEYVASAPCRDEAELRDFYTRCGALLALVTFLRGGDCHFENVIASGSHPVIIDHEALLAPSTHLAPDDGSGIGVLQHRLQSSVLRTGLLPEWTVEPGGNVVDLSGIGARRSARATKTLRIANVNSDGMAIETRSVVSTGALVNEPTVEGAAPLSASDTERLVKDGFQIVYRLLASHDREALLAHFAGLPTRFVARTTLGYSMLLRESRSPALMRDGLVQTLALDRIARMLLVGSTERPVAWPLIRAEHVAISRGDVPFFALRTDAVALYECEPEQSEMRPLAEGVFIQSGLGAARDVARGMSEEELGLEMELIASSFEGKAAGVGEPREGAPPGETPFDQDRARSIALEMAHEIRESVLLFRGGHYRIGLEFDDVARVHRVALLGADMYNGNSGIALFLGVASRIGRDERLHTAALSTLAQTRAFLRRDPVQLVAGIGLGGFEGLGSLIYAFAELGRWLDDPSLIDDARLIARSISRAQIDASRSHDVLSGTAGLVFALAALDRITESKTSAEMIAHCGRRLVETAVERGGGVGWPLHPDAPPLCGMAHGNAGIAAALFEAWRLGGASELRDTARRALAYERGLRNDEAQNWPDLRADVAAGSFMSTWCNGAPGIALARSRMLAVEDHADLREDLALAIAATKVAALPGGHICCGMAGIDEILFEVGSRTKDAVLVDLARRRTMSRITSLTHDGVWPRVVVRGLMRGSAGIGLGLLRMTHAGEEVPCVLDLSA